MQSAEGVDVPETLEDFYAKCGEILEIEHVWVTPNVRKGGRWNRKLGNGRFAGYGVIRPWGTGYQVMSRSQGSKVFNTQHEVYEFLKR